MGLHQTRKHTWTPLLWPLSLQALWVCEAWCDCVRVLAQGRAFPHHLLHGSFFVWPGSPLMWLSRFLEAAAELRERALEPYLDSRAMIPWKTGWHLSTVVELAKCQEYVGPKTDFLDVFLCPKWGLSWRWAWNMESSQRVICELQMTWLDRIWLKVN